MLPLPIPLLNEEQWKVVEKEFNRKPTKEEIERIKRIIEKFKDYPLL